MIEGRGSADSHQSQYRPHIDGLRALAVLSVVFFHFSETALPGGYLGVDIFFVISGYLITNVIWREAVNGEFSMARFYERRVRRIMPALLALLIVVSALAVALLLPIDLKGYAKSVFASLAFVANIYFWRDTNYFAQVASEKPLLHLWSLGVEEQFYILFPMLVVLCTKWRRSFLIPVIVFLVILSFAGNAYALHIGGSTPAFYLLPTRAWEIGSGSLLALLGVAGMRSKWLRQILAALAATLLVLGLLFNGAHLGGDSIPSAVWVVLGTTLAIYIGEAGGSWLTGVLSLTPVTFVGLISYSLYLWHWPLLVFAKYYLIEQNIPFLQAAVLFALMFALATLSWRYVERPFRNRSMPIRRVVSWVACGCAAMALLSGLVLRSGGFPSRYSPAVARINAAVGSEFQCGIAVIFPFGASHACLLATWGDNPAVADVALVGNSYAQMYGPLVSDILRQKRLAGILVPLPDCLPIPDFNVSQECMAKSAVNLKAVESLPRVRVVILAMRIELNRQMFTPQGAVPENRNAGEFCESLDRVIQTLEHDGKTVVVVGPIAIPGYEAPSVVARQIAFGHPVTEPMYSPAADFQSSYSGILSHYASRRDITFIRPDLIECQKGKCDFFRNGISLFADASHLGQGSLPLFRPVFEPALDQVFLRDHL